MLMKKRSCIEPTVSKSASSTASLGPLAQRQDKGWRGFTGANIPVAVPRKSAYRRLRSSLDRATDPSSEPSVRMNAPLMDLLGPAFPVLLKSRRFRTSPKPFAFLQLRIGGQMLRFHPFAAFTGKHELRISKTSGLTYLTEPHTSRTWVSTLEPFRTARRAGREASAVAIAAPFADLDSARRCAPRLVSLAQWLKAQRRNAAAPAIDGQPLPVVLSGRVVAGLHIIDPVTGRQLVTLRSQSLHAGGAALTVRKESLQLTQDGTVVYFPVKDLLARWGNQLTRSAIYASAEEARQRAAELGTHRALGRLTVQALGFSRKPSAELLARLEAFSANAEMVSTDRRGGISLALPKRIGGPRKIAFRLTEFGPRARFTPALWGVPHQGLMVLWAAADGNVAAFGVSRREVRRFGVFESAEAARKAALLDPAVLIREACIRKRERDLANDVWGRIAKFNSADVRLKADKNQVLVANVFTGAILRFRTSSSRGLWSPKIMLSPVGPLWVMFARNSGRRPSWLVYGPIAKQGMGSQILESSAEGRGHITLETLAVLLSKRLSMRVTAVGPERRAVATLDDVYYILRRVVPGDFQNWHRKDRDGQVRMFYEYAEVLRESLLSVDAACRREALVVAEYFYFGKPCEHILALHAPLFNRGSGDWPAVLGVGGRADARAKEIACGLSVFVLERPKHGLPDTMQRRFAKFYEAMIQLRGI